VSLLNDLANKYRTDKGSDGHRYHGFADFYAHFWEDSRTDVSALLEIGVNDGLGKTMNHGASQRMFQEYFPNAVIYGADINDKFLFNEDRIITFQADQNDEKGFLEALERVSPGRTYFDIIIDDGSHEVIHQQVTLGFLFPKVEPGGWYVVEDLHTSNWGWGLPAGHQDAALPVLKRFAASGKIDSKYMDANQAAFIGENAEFCQVYEEGSDHVTAIIKRRART